MRSVIGTASAIASLTLIALCIGRLEAQAISQQSAIVDGVSAFVTVEPFAPHPQTILIRATWKATPNSKYPVGCLSVFHDLRYELRDNTGKLVPIDRQTLEHPLYDGPGLLNHMEQGHPLSCAQRQPYPGKVELQSLYPGLPNGEYVLKITFAPRGLTQSATLTPVHLTVAN